MGTRLSGAGGLDGRAIQQNADINVTPFVDIMLVLLIIFMVAAPLATVSLKLDLPPAERTTLPPKEPVIVSVQASGAIFVDGKETSAAALASHVCAALGGGACIEERIFVRAEADVPYERFMGVMNGLKASGFTHVGLVNEDID